MKMIEIIFIFVITAVLLVNSAKAGIQNDLYYNATLIIHPFNATLNNRTGQSGNLLGGTETPSVDTNNKQTGSSSLGFRGGSAGTRLNFGNANRSATINQSCFFWSNSTESINGVSRHIMGNSDGGGQAGEIYLYFIDDNLRLVYGIGGSSRTLSGVIKRPAVKSHWNMYGFIINRTTTQDCISLFQNTTTINHNCAEQGGASANDWVVGGALDANNGLGSEIGGGLDAVACWNKTLTYNEVEWYYNWTNGTNELVPETEPSSSNNTPTITINFPQNNSLTHNMTPLINFTISDIEKDNITNLQIFIDKQNNPTTRINLTNTTQGNFSFVLPLLNNNTGSSFNGTYFIKINGTDNSTNFFSVIHSFNLTNNISAYNVTNVSITPLPLSVNTDSKCHYNITNHGGSQINDNISLTDLHWYINNTQYKPANNLTTLNAGNATLNANITCEARINNGFGETAWTQYVNSSQITVGDTIAPTITNQSINGNSFISTDRVNVTAICTDSGSVDSVKVEHNGTGTYSNSTAVLLGSNIYSYNALFAIGKYNVTNIYCTDSSGNIARDASNFTFTVSTAGGGEGGSSGGSGGGGGGSITIIEEIIELSNISLLLRPPIISSNFIYGALKTGITRYSITLTANKVLKSCESRLFECHIKNNTAVIALNYSSRRFISVVKEPITVIDRSENAKTINAKVRFINLGVAIPLDTSTASRNYIVFRLREGMIDGIRIWFIIAVAVTVITGIYLYSEYG